MDKLLGKGRSYAYTLTFSLLITIASLSTGLLFTLPALAQTCSPALIGRYDTPGRAFGVYVSGGTAYVADGDRGLQIIDVSDPTNPTLLGSYNSLFGDTRSVFLLGRTAYIADGSLKIIDVSDPTHPTPLGHYFTPGAAKDVYVSGRTAYVADGDLQIIDVFNPTAPVLLGSYNMSNATDVYVLGTEAYVVDASIGLRIIDVSTPTAPVLLGSYNTPFFAEGIHVSGSTAYMADAFHGLQVINVSDPTHPTLLGSYDISSISRGVYVLNNTAYLAAVGVWVIDVSDQTNPTYLGDYGLSIGNDVYVSGGTAYVADSDNGLQIVDVSGCGDNVVECQCSEDRRGGCISGSVMTYLTGEPVAGKTVLLKTLLRKARKKFVKRVVTDENGCYGFDNLPKGRYTVYTKGGCKAVGGKGRRHYIKINRNGEVNDMDFDCR